MPTLLLELFSEEIPSRMQRNAAEQLERLVTEGLKKNMLSFEKARSFVSPRHLALQVFGLPAVQPDVKEEKRGPKLGAPEQALKGFLQATGLTLEQCEQRDGYYYANIERKGRAVAEVLKEICQSALADFSWPKSMHWGSRDKRPQSWVRPLHRIACLLDAQVVPVTFAHLTASNVTEGHRFLSPEPITIAHAEQYEATLNKAHVLVDFAARREKIAAAIKDTASAAKLSVIEDEQLLNEVTGLVEWPVPLLAKFDKKFLDLPQEVLISELKVHQRYFALKTADGSLSDSFIIVANMVNADGGKQVTAGNERVVRARLSDGEFYWEQDKKTKLEDWGKKLSDVVFHAKVGMMDEKVKRIEKLALEIAKAVDFSATDAVKRAALLCKADLTSGMVGEFPELQGIMGRYYAIAQGEPAAICEAIYEHYKPMGAGDSLPESTLAAIIAIADKLDSIISLFAAGEKPTGSKDPLALRRAALGVLRIILSRDWNLDLARICNKEVIEFFYDRLRQVLRDEGVSASVIEAGLKADSNSFAPVALATTTKALDTWLASPSGAATLPAIKRVLNILAAEEKKAKTIFKPTLSDTLSLPEEKALLEAAKKPVKSVADLDALASPINAFFDKVLVTEEQFRTARLGLLAALREMAYTIADFSKIEG